MLSKRVAFCLLAALAIVVVTTILYPHAIREDQRHPIEELAHVARDEDGAIVAVKIKGNRAVGYYTLAQLRDLPRLKLLDLGIQENMTDADLVALRELKELDDLSLNLSFNAPNVTDAGVAHLAGLTKLQTLRLSQTKVTDAGLVHLQGLTNLKYLWLDGSVTDDGLASLAGLTNLRRLSLRRNQISGTGLSLLKGLDHLEYLDLMGNQLSGLTELTELRKLLPQCTITFTEHPFLDALITTEGDLVAALESTARNITLDDQGQIVSLDLTSTPLNPFELEYLKSLKSLKELHVSLASGDMRFDLRGFENIERLELSNATACDGLDTLRNLRALRVRGSTDASQVVQLTRLPKLEQLVLGHAPVVQVPDDALAYLRYFARLKSLTIERDYNAYFADTELAAISKATGLEQLVLRGGRHSRGGMSYQGREHLQKLTNLRTLVLDIPGHLTDASLQALNPLQNLRSLHVNGYLTDVGLMHLKELRNLEELTLESWGALGHLRHHYEKKFPSRRFSIDMVSGAGLAQLADLKNLKRLHLEGQVSPSCLVRLGELSASQLGDLQALSIRPRLREQVTIPDVVFAFFKNLPELETLDLTGVNVTDAALEHLAGSRKLKSLTLAKSPITDKGVNHILPLTQLEKLNLSETQITDSAIANLSSLHNLKELDLDHCPNVTITAIRQLKSQLPEVSVTFNPLMAYGLHDFEQFGTHLEFDANDNLTVLRAGGFGGFHPERLTDEHLASLGSFETLIELFLHGTSVTDKGLIALNGLPNLKALIIQGSTAITDAGVGLLKDLSQLTVLSLHHCPEVTNVGLADLQGMTQLQKLSLGFCPLISDQGLTHLKGMSQLQFLSLAYCPKISDEGLEHLRGLTNLQELNLMDTGVTYSGVYRLQRALPWCRIHWP